MSGPDLYALLHGEIVGKRAPPHSGQIAKSKFDLEIEKEIESYLSTLSWPADSHALVTPAQQKRRAEEELKTKSTLSDFSNHIDHALQILTSEGKAYLDAASYQSLQDDFEQASWKLDELDPAALPDESFQSLLDLSKTSIDAIYTIALAKYNQGQCSHCLSLFVLLAILSPEKVDYWYRSAIAAQIVGDHALAIRLFSASIALDPQYIGSWVFIAESYRNIDRKHEAEAAYAEVLKLKEMFPGKYEEWTQVITDLQGTLKSS